MEAALLLVLLMISPAVYAVDHIVGGSSGWSQSVNYAAWASSQTFNLNDNLVFNYDPTSHSVDQVSQSDYNSCSSGGPLQSYSGGSTNITLNRSGAWYFLCPTSGHCAAGMKLAINVSSSGSAPSGSPPSPPAPSGSSGTPPPPPPPRSAATRVYGGMNHMMIGFAFVLSACLALVC